MYYYKDINGNYYSFNKEHKEDNLIAITNAEWQQHINELHSITNNNYAKQIREYKKLLNDTDYKYFKYVDGELTEEEWQVIQNQRKEWRRQIRLLEN